MKILLVAMLFLFACDNEYLMLDVDQDGIDDLEDSCIGGIIDDCGNCAHPNTVGYNCNDIAVLTKFMELNWHELDYTYDVQILDALSFGEQSWSDGRLTSFTLRDDFDDYGQHGTDIVIPGNIGDWEMIVSLDLSNNYDWSSADEFNITSLPESIGNLSNLEFLYLTNQFLSSLPTSIGNLSSLKRLYLGNNELTSLPESIGNLSNLETLYLNDNSLTSIPESIGSLINLGYLDLYNNNLTSLPAGIGNLNNLEFLYLWYNNLTSLPESICDAGEGWGNPGEYDVYINVKYNELCEEFRYPCISYNDWTGQNQNTCCEGVNDDGESVSNWTQCEE